jgi:tetratricopeptide (TPR) repeat protein
MTNVAAVLLAIGPIVVCAVPPAAAQRTSDARDCDQNEIERRIAGCTRLIEQGPSNMRAGALNNRGIAYFVKKDFTRSLADYDEALRIDPRYLKAYVNRALTLSAMGDRAREIQDWDMVIRLNPRHANAYRLRGAALSLQGEHDRAIRDLDEAIRLSPRDAEIYALRGEAYRLKGEPERALRDLDQALRMGPKDADSYRYRGLARGQGGDLDGALADAREHLRLRGNNPEAVISEREAAMTLGTLLREGKQYAACADAYSRAIAGADRDDWKAFYYRGFCLEKSRQWERAEADLKKALELFPEQPDVMSHLGYGWLVRGVSEEEGGALIRRAAELRPDDGFIAGALGLAHLKRGRYADAARSLEQALKLKGDDADARSHLGDAYWRLDRKGEAIAQWTQARSLERDAPALAKIDDKLRRGLPDPPSATVAAPPAAPVVAAVVPRASGGPDRPGRRIALVIGNSAYQGVPALANPRRDAAAVASALRSVGFQAVRLEGDLAREKLVDTLRGFAREAASADWAVVYFAGHGLEVGGTNYLVPVDARLESDRDVQYEAVALEQVVGAVEGARKLRLVILDACRDNPFVSRMKRTVASRSIGRGLARVEPEGGTLVAYAAKGGEIALDGAGSNSPFVGALLKHLPTPGLEIGKLFRQVRDDVLAATSRKQEPFVYGSLPGEDFFVATR